MYKEILLARYFNAMSLDESHEPPEETIHMGLLQNLDLTEYTDLTILADLDYEKVDAYIYNNLSRKLVRDQWLEYMTWDKARKRWIISTQFYADFALALYGELLTPESYYLLTQMDVDKIKTHEEITRDYGKTKNTKKHLSSDTIAHGAREDGVTTNTGAQTITDTSTIAPTQETTDNKVFAFDASAYVNNDKTQVDTIQRIDEVQRVAGAREDGVTSNIGAQTDTYTFGDVTDENDARKDEEERDKSVTYDPEKLVKVKSELAELSVFALMARAVDNTLCNSVWG